MDITKLKNLADKNEVRIDDHKGHKRNPPHYYDLLRNALEFYFKTFITNNTSYDFYISATTTDKRKALKILEQQFLDTENTVLCLVSFERFFELFLKDLLRKANFSLTHFPDKQAYQKAGRKAPKNTWEILQQIQKNNFISKKDERGRHLSIPFRETINRVYSLIDYSKDKAKKSDRLIKRFSKIFSQFLFLDNLDSQATLEFLNSYRDRILHSGNKLPRLRFLDFIITQRIIPIVNKILATDKAIPTEWKYFSETVSGIKILEAMEATKFNLRNAKNKVNETFDSLLLIGHLKELGRANLNMNHNMRNNRATYEYNYHDVKGRANRFTTIENTHFQKSQIRNCPCCSEKSLVKYQTELHNYLGTGKTLIIQWVKCYLCDYYLRYDVLDLHYFNRRFEKLFDYSPSLQSTVQLA